MDKVSSILAAEDLIDKTLGAGKTTSDVLLLENGNISFTAYDMYFYSIDTKEMYPFTTFTNKLFEPEDFKDEVQGYLIERIMGQIYNPNFNAYLMNMYHLYRETELPLLARIENMQDIDIYRDMFNIKSDMGVYTAHIPSINDPSYTYPFYFYAGLVKLNKSDRLDLEIYDLDQNHYVYALHLYKKKMNNTIHVFYKTLKLR